ncbi:MAG: hypothetical protein ACKVU1_03605 [bacterium]
MTRALALAIASCVALTGCYTELRLPEQRVAYEEEEFREEPQADPHADLPPPDPQSLEVTVDSYFYWVAWEKCSRVDPLRGFPLPITYDCIRPVDVGVNIRNLGQESVVVEGSGRDGVVIYVEEGVGDTWYSFSVAGPGDSAQRIPPSLFPGTWLTRTVRIDKPGWFRVAVKGLSIGADPEVFYYSPPFEVRLR